MNSLQKVLILLRSDITNEEYCKNLLTLQKCMKETANAVELYKLVRKDLLPQEAYGYIVKKDNQKAFCDNWEMVNASIYFIKQCINNLISLIHDKSYEQAYDYADWFHAFPEAILEKKKWDKNKFREIYVVPYEKKWNVVTKFDECIMQD